MSSVAGVRLTRQGRGGVSAAAAAVPRSAVFTSEERVGSWEFKAKKQKLLKIIHIIHACYKKL